MIYINNEVFPLDEIVAYEGDDDIIVKIGNKYRELQNDHGFMSGDEPKIIKHRKGTFKIVSNTGFKEGKKGIYVPFSAVVKSKMGTKMITVCESAIPSDAGYVYEPRGDWFKKKWVLGPDKIELLLFMILFCPEIQSGKIVIEDLAGDAFLIAKERGKKTNLEFYLYNDMSHIYNNRKRLEIIAQVFGISSVGNIRDINVLKNAIFRAVEKAELDNSGMGYKQFKELVSGTVKVNYKMRALVQDAVDKGIIYFDSKEDYAWKMSSALSGTNPKILTRVAPSESDDAVDILVAHLQGKSADYELIALSCNPEELMGEAGDEVEEESIRRVDRPSKPLAEMKMFELWKYSARIGHPYHRKKKAALIQELEDILNLK